MVKSSELVCNALALVAILLSLPSHAWEPEFHGYFRSGTGFNSKGGDQHCVKNSGTKGNEFRLGQECSNYGELTFKHINRPKTNTDTSSMKDESDPIHWAQLTFAYAPEGHSSYETGFLWAMPELFFEGQMPQIKRATAWVGRRFYRDRQTQINDFFYFADMSGQGAGFTVTQDTGKWSLAYLQEVPSDNSGDEQDSSVGLMINRAIDFRFMDFEIVPNHLLNFWLAGAMTPQAQGLTPAESYTAQSGFSLGLRHQWKFKGGDHHLSGQYGEGLLESLNMSGDVSQTEGHSSGMRSRRWRWVSEADYQINSKWAWHWLFSFESWTYPVAGEWTSLAFRPIYFFNPLRSIILEVGGSRVRDYDATENEDRYLGRVTLAPQIQWKEGIWGRPVLRVFYSYSFWNRENREKLDSNGQNLGGVAYVADLNASNIGVQGEVWF